MSSTKSIKELLAGRGTRPAQLATRTRERSRALEHVCAALPAPLAAKIVTAGVTGGVLTIGVAGAAWAARLRYVTDALKDQVGASLGTPLEKVKIKVVPAKSDAG